MSRAVWTQTWAVFYDAYRALNARRLFWFVLAISGLVAASFALVGIDREGLQIAFWHINVPLPGWESMAPAFFYKTLFVNFGIRFWLTWIATALALVSTAGIFPEFIASGAIDLVVSKPIGRLRLFLTQYLAGLLFVLLQVTLFSAAALLVIGLRGGVWEPGLLVAIPVVVCFFSYLYCVCVLLGLLTRSTVAALLLTILFWIFLWALGQVEQTMLTFEVMERQRVSWADVQSARPGVDGEDRGTTPGAADDAGDSTLPRVRRVLLGVRTVLPKTQETIAVLEQSLIDLAELPPDDSARARVDRAVAGELRQRSPAWSIGTSLLFELAVLALAATIFCRRDF